MVFVFQITCKSFLLPCFSLNHSTLSKIISCNTSIISNWAVCQRHSEFDNSQKGNKTVQPWLHVKSSQGVCGGVLWQPYLSCYADSAHINFSATSVTLIKNKKKNQHRRQRSLNKVHKCGKHSKNHTFQTNDSAAHSVTRGHWGEATEMLLKSITVTPKYMCITLL